MTFASGGTPRCNQAEKAIIGERGLAADEPADAASGSTDSDFVLWRMYKRVHRVIDPPLTIANCIGGRVDSVSLVAPGAGPIGNEGMAGKRIKDFNLKAFFAHIGDGRQLETYQPDQTIFSQGDPADAVFYIQKGKVKVTVVSEQGKEAVAAILDKAAFFGEGALAGQARRVATASAMTETEVVRLDRAAILGAIQEEPGFAQLFIVHLLTRAVRVEADLVDQLFNSSEKRLARLLLLLANFGKEGKPEPVLPKISLETLAQMIGTTRARVSFFMNKFRKLGLINYNGHIEVHSSLLNVVLHEQPEIKDPSQDLPA